MEHPALDVLERQRIAWNRGDRADYVAACAPEVTYLNARGVVFGRDALDRALAGAYPDPAAMGTLTLEVLRFDVSPGEARVVLRWEVRRAGAPVGGVALVILQERDGAWWMTHDATVTTA